MKKLIFCNYNYIISKYFRILKHVKEIKQEYLKFHAEMKSHIKSFKTTHNRLLLRKSFNILYQNKLKKASLNQNLAMIHRKNRTYLLKKHILLWSKSLKIKVSLIKFHKTSLNMILHNKAENFKHIKNYVFWKKSLFILRNSENTTTEAKSELEVRLEAKYRNLEKLIMRFENFKNLTTTNAVSKENDTSLDQELLILKSLIKSQMKDIEDLKLTIN